MNALTFDERSRLEETARILSKLKQPIPQLEKAVFAALAENRKPTDVELFGMGDKLFNVVRMCRPYVDDLDAFYQRLDYEVSEWERDDLENIRNIMLQFGRVGLLVLEAGGSA